MTLRIVLFVSILVAAPLASAGGTGSTHPEKAREHPLDSREPRQGVIESDGASQGQPRPPTLETLPDVPPETPAESPPQPARPDTRSIENGDPASAT